MAAPPEVRKRAQEIVDLVVNVIISAKRPLLWHEVVDGFYAEWNTQTTSGQARHGQGLSDGFMHERTLYRHVCSAAKHGRIAVHGRSRARIYTAPGVRLSPKDKLVAYEGQRGRRITEEDLL